jgi:hypothetical protein
MRLRTAKRSRTGLPKNMCFWATSPSRTQTRKIRDLRGRRKEGFLGKREGVLFAPSGQWLEGVKEMHRF